MRIGIDIGGTRIKAGVVDDAGVVRARRVVAVGSERDQAAVVTALAGLLGGLAHGEPGGIRAVGVAAAGVIERERGLIRESPNFPAWRDFALGVELAAATGLTISLENDANAVILGEARAGAGRGASSLLGLTLGTGVGGGVILDGRLWRGARGMAGELGHVTMEPRGRACGCGNRGCLEQYAGAVGIRQTLRERRGALADLAGTSDAPRALAELARHGDPDAREVWREVGAYVGQAVAGFVHALDVTRVVVAGGIAFAADLFLPAADETFRARAFRSMSEGVDLRAGTLGEDAGIIGAALAVDD